ncbi:type I 3-dehydroquinate dehydratase [Haloarcula brevis]|uniref:type I 3-dehydroquinate dehydratase n=1 Tax=Haloarcula brevis TaxID=3111453 RepID=UPI00300F1B74
MDDIEYDMVGTTDDLRDEPLAREHADYVEFRMDGATAPVDQLTEYDGELPLIVSNRPEWAGGAASESNRLEELLAAASSDAVAMVKIDLETIRTEAWLADELRENEVDVIVAYYDFEQTPEKSELQELILECDEYGDVSKVSVFAEEREDALLLLDCLNAASQSGVRVSGVSLGELGQHTRVIGVFYGSELCFAPIQLDTEAKYGEIELAQLANLLETTVHGGDHVELID